jgi:sn-glycerol 3-phosphate transport system substrate-binding protein
MFSIDIYEMIEQDAIIAFDDIVETPEEKAWLDSFYPTLMANGRTGGKTWGIPFQRSTIVMYYNKDAFKAAGLDPEKPPENWDQLVAAGQALTKADGSQWGVMIPSTGYPYWMFGALTMQNDQVLMNDAGNETYFDSPAVVEALQFWRDLGAKHKIMPEGTIEWGTLRQNFLEGQTAIMWHSTGNLTIVKNTAKFDFGVAMLPAKKRRGTPTGGGNFYIFKQTSAEERKAAMRLIKFMTSPERSAEWSMKTGYMGISPAAYETVKLKEYVKVFPYAAVARDQLEYATAELSTYQTGRVRKALDDAIQAALTGAKTPEVALREAQELSDRLLKQYR